MVNSYILLSPIRPEDCDIGLAYYKYLEASYINKVGNWLNNAL